MKIASGIRALLLAMLFVLTRSAVSAQTLPSPWAGTDIGNPQIAGTSTYSSGTFTITASGTDIWGTSDQFRFVYRPITGDVEIIARIASISTQAHRWSKAGVMIRESLTAESRHVMMVGSAAAGYAFQRRAQTGGSSDSTAGPATNPPGWVRLVRAGDQFSAYFSTTGVNWQLVGTDTIPMGNTVYVGLPVTSHASSATATAKLDSVTVISASTPNQPPAISITAPAANSQYTAPASVAINATATDPENAMLSVDFYANQTLISRDTTAPYSATFTTSTSGGYSLTAVAHDADGNSTTSGAIPITVQGAGNQAPTVSLTSPAGGAQFSAPATISLAANATDPENQMARVEFYSGATLLGTDTTSPYSFSWTNVAAGTYSLTAKAFDTAGGTSTSAAVSVTVNATAGGLPNGMSAADVGGPAITGQTSYSNGTYTVRGGGADIWDPVDQFQFAYQQVTGDTEIVARVVSMTNTDAWAKAAVMIRETLTGNARHATLAITPTASTGAWFARRLQAGGATVRTIQGTTTAPAWVRLVRAGNVITGYWSTNGTTWTLVGSDTISMTSTVYVGLVANSHSTSAATTVVFDNVSIKTGTGNQAPTVALTAPANGATFTAPATINLTANASDPENQLARVEFYSGTTLLGTDTTAPYSFSWGSVAAGTYSLTAKAYDTGGASATSSAMTVTVSGTTSGPPTTLVFTASADHTTNVTSYRLSVYTAGSNTTTATPVATSDLGKPTPNANNEITVDRAAFFSALAPGNYVAVVTAIGPGGQTPSSPPVAFTR